jgi:hypothetical protein
MKFPTAPLPPVMTEVPLTTCAGGGGRDSCSGVRGVGVLGAPPTAFTGATGSCTGAGRAAGRDLEGGRTKGAELILTALPQLSVILKPSSS